MKFRPIRICLWPVEDCHNACEGNTIYCASHNHELRKQERNAKKEKKVYVIPKKSPKQNKKDRLYAKQRPTFLEQNPMCQLKLQCCIGKATQVHHSKKRGENTNDVDSFMAACQPCHDFIETRMSATERREKGFLK